MILLVLLIVTYVMRGEVKETATTSQNNRNEIQLILNTLTNTNDKEIQNNKTNLIEHLVKQYHIVQSSESWKNYIRQEKQVINHMLSITNQSEKYNFEDFALALVMIKNDQPVSAPRDYINISFPMEIFQTVSDAPKKVGLITYKSNWQFNPKNVYIISKVIRIEVGREIVNLTNPLKIFFPVDSYTNKSNNKYAYSCHYYDEKENGTWKTDGCVTTQFKHMVECACDHLTAFAVLLVDLENDSIDETQWEILSYISYIGCFLSTMFTAFSILSFIFNKHARAEMSSRIHVSLSGALFLLNMSFMLSELAATLTMTGCVFVAVTIHYSLLSSFTWMAIEAMHLYLLLGRVFNIHFKHYMIKLSLIGWGVPAVVVGSLLSLHEKHHIYGTSEVTFSNRNATNAYCWITEPLVLYGVNLSYFTIIFIFNIVILITVSRQIFKLKQVDNKNKFKPLKDTITVLGIMCLLGSSWGLVFLGSGYTNYTILYLFCISNTMQGFSVFLWMCRTSRPEKRKAAHTKSLSTINSTIEKPQL